MSGRQIFSESEKVCLQELIMKYEISSMRTMGAGNPAVKKTAWARLTNEFNSIESNTRRTEAQLKKCWDNLKTRRKQVLAMEKRERMRTGRGPYLPQPSTSQENIDDALLAHTDVEMQFAIDSDLTVHASEEIDTAENTAETEPINSIDSIPLRVLVTEDTFGESEVVAARQADSFEQGTSRVVSAPAQIRNTGRGSGSRLSDYDNMSQTPGVRNIRSHVINEEFNIRKNKYLRNEEREEELHQLIKKELEYVIKSAEQNYLTSVIACQCAKNKALKEELCAEERLKYFRAKREAAELNLANLKKKCKQTILYLLS